MIFRDNYVATHISENIGLFTFKLAWCIGLHNKKTYKIYNFGRNWHSTICDSNNVLQG